jgi:hypothetical protein
MPALGLAGLAARSPEPVAESKQTRPLSVTLSTRFAPEAGDRTLGGVTFGGRDARNGRDQCPKTSRCTSGQVKTMSVGRAPQSFTKISVMAGLKSTFEVASATPMRMCTCEPGEQ